jgi:NTE family protein
MLSCDLLQRNIGIALSGGGVRAIAFHAGVLQRMAENGWLERIGHISSVSGGSLFAGLLFQTTNNCWPTSAQYLNHTLPHVRNLLTSKSLQTDALCRLIFNPFNWHFILSRANILRQSIEYCWGVTATLDQLPQWPVWSINGTTAENGKRFRFKGSKIGDYEIGYADTTNYKLAIAMAVSAAFPGGIGPLMLNTTNYQWRKQENWDSMDSVAMVTPKLKKIHLYDGGVYDNLGLESLFDMGKQILKQNNEVPIDFIIVSDAGAPFPRNRIPGPLNPLRLRRLADVAFDQVRSLRVRSFVNFLKNNLSMGMYLQIGSNPIECIKQYEHSSGAITSNHLHSWMSEKEVSKATGYKTTLARMRESDFDLIARHGYETALWNELVFMNV